MSSEHDLTFLQEAIDLARDAVESGRGGPFGAVIVRAGQVIGRGQNRVLADLDPSAHAEVVAIRDAAKNLEDFSLAGCTLFTSCEPCPMCLATSLWARIDEIVYAGTREDAARAGFDDSAFYDQIQGRAEPSYRMRNLAREAAQPVFEAWLAKDDRTPY